MSKFQQLMAKNPPHVVVKYVRGATREDDTYSYAINGSMPMGQLIGFIVRVQAELAFRNPDPCDKDLCVIAFNSSTHKFEWFVDGSIPVDPLVGTLELVKALLVDSQMSHILQAAAAKQRTGLVSQDGKPLLRN